MEAHPLSRLEPASLITQATRKSALGDAELVAEPNGSPSTGCGASVGLVAVPYSQ